MAASASAAAGTYGETDYLAGPNAGNAAGDLSIKSPLGVVAVLCILSPSSSLTQKHGIEDGITGSSASASRVSTDI